MKPSLKVSLKIVACTAVLLFIDSASKAVDAETFVSAQYFDQMTKVLQSPRCLNCHPGDDRPHQGQDMHAHIMNVGRGPNDHGNVGMKCATCHQDANNEVSGIPGAPKWALAPKSMAWLGLSKHDLCLAIKDVNKNGGMSLEKLVHHNGEDTLVGWAWHPGHGREPAPGTQKAFGALTKMWVDSGAQCP
jgi:hypothetical protein